MTIKHTPEPWAYSYESTDQEWAVVTGFGGLVVANVNDVNDGDRQQANARLIAAAPELLAALQAVLSVADRQTVEFDMARAAIAKATGEAA
jgi:hypothetical protein